MRRQFACMCNVLLIITVGSTFSFMWWWVYSTDCVCIYMELGHSFSWHKQFSLMMTTDFHLKTTTKKGSVKKRRQSKFIYVAPLRYKAVQSTLQSQGNTSEIMIIKWIIKHIQNKIYEKKKKKTYKSCLRWIPVTKLGDCWLIQRENYLKVHWIT